MFVEIGKGISPNFQQLLELLLAKREYIAFAPDTEETRQMINLISIKFPVLQVLFIDLFFFLFVFVYLAVMNVGNKFIYFSFFIFPCS